MRVKVPKQVKVGAHTYAVIYKPNLSADTGFRGTLEHRVQQIWIEPNKPDSQKGATFLHEVIHFISTISSCHLDDDNVDRLAEGLVAFLKENFDITLDWSDIEEEP